MTPRYPVGYDNASMALSVNKAIIRLDSCLFYCLPFDRQQNAPQRKKSDWVSWSHHQRIERKPTHLLTLCIGWQVWRLVASAHDTGNKNP
ncbi:MULTISPECIES: hypothetical protein [unclassified Moraxella]|uniref:hypothetical protein n=1 Tax=unclassified Moraxella TaxID=2685852 RepID=UPI00359EC600